MTALRDDVIAAWRFCIQHGRVQLGQFNWPWALGSALDEIAALRSEAQAVRDAAAAARATLPTVLTDAKQAFPPGTQRVYAEGYAKGLVDGIERAVALLEGNDQ